VIKKLQLPNFETVNPLILDSIRQLRLVDRGTSGGSRSTIGGWHSTDQSVVNLPGFDVLVEFLRKQVGDFDAIWVCVNGRGHYNRRHQHNPGRMSGAYYVTTPSPVAAIVFHGEQDVRVEPEPGMLLVFDGGYEHSVEPNQADADRVVVSCNFV
jgi:hypothetical protein